MVANYPYLTNVDVEPLLRVTLFGSIFQIPCDTVPATFEDVFRLAKKCVEPIGFK